MELALWDGVAQCGEQELQAALACFRTLKEEDLSCDYGRTIAGETHEPIAGLLLCGDARPMRFEKNKNATLRGERLRFEAMALNNGQEVRQVDI